MNKIRESRIECLINHEGAVWLRARIRCPSAEDYHGTHRLAGVGTALRREGPAPYLHLRAQYRGAVHSQDSGANLHERGCSRGGLEEISGRLRHGLHRPRPEHAIGE